MSVKIANYKYRNIIVDMNGIEHSSTQEFDCGLPVEDTVAACKYAIGTNASMFELLCALTEQLTEETGIMHIYTTTDIRIAREVMEGRLT